jgi:hypothetical protein
MSSRSCAGYQYKRRLDITRSSHVPAVHTRPGQAAPAMSFTLPRTATSRGYLVQASSRDAGGKMQPEVC